MKTSLKFAGELMLLVLSSGTSFASGSMYCGSSWIDAATSCGTPCPSGNSTICGYGMRCWADIPSCNPDPETPAPVTPSPTPAPVQQTTPSPTQLTSPPTNCPPLFDPVEVYNEGDKVMVEGSVYVCKPFPNSGWCDQAGYEPGTSVHWRDAWELIGPCSTGPTADPTESPTESPVVVTNSPTKAPAPITASPTKAPVVLPPPTTASPHGEGVTASNVEAILEANKLGMDNNLFIYETPESTWLPSTVYRYDGFLAGLHVMYEDGVAGKKFYIGDDSTNGHEYGLVNIAAFLAQSMKETIKYDACDENSWDLINSQYPLSNACGQLSQSYQDYHCSPEEAHMECPVDPEMQITAITNAKWWGAPGPLKCGPKSVYPETGYWDHSQVCDDIWADPPKYCTDYEGQKAGGENNDNPVANRNGRTDVEGCCWWGRGVIQTTGVCNFGKMNYYLGKRAADENRPSRYPTIDFCKDPEAICASEEFQELKWIAGMFYWVESLQTYDVGGWNYLAKLHEFVDGGMTDTSFIDSVSGVVNRGCHNPPCGTGPLDGGPERRTNFQKVLQEFGLM